MTETPWFGPDTPAWKFYAVIVGIALAGSLALVAINSGMTALGDTVNQAPYFIISAKYTNSTTLYVKFAEGDSFVPTNHFTISAAKVDRVDIILDEILIDTIYNLTYTPYIYSVSPQRHDMKVIITFKNGVTQEKIFSNAQLEGSR